jgi:2-haloacid dehalogenase
MTQIVVFDVNETLLDMSALDGHFECVFGDAAARATWFQQLKENWHVAAIIGRFVPFNDLVSAALRMTGKAEGIQLARAYIRRHE